MGVGIDAKAVERKAWKDYKEKGKRLVPWNSLVRREYDEEIDSCALQWW
jgi:hypothetical protein